MVKCTSLKSGWLCFETRHGSELLADTDSRVENGSPSLSRLSLVFNWKFASFTVKSFQILSFDCNTG